MTFKAVEITPKTIQQFMDKLASAQEMFGQLEALSNQRFDPKQNKRVTYAELSVADKYKVIEDY
ncbi:MAG: hypothetical protein QQN41_06010, partial [Nitrosopumilus sp.]